MREKILIVEDEEEIAMLEQDYLEINGFQTRIESDGEQAVELAPVSYTHLTLPTTSRV